MNKSEIISFLGSVEIYEEYKNLVIEELKRLIDFYGYTKNFEETNVYEQFAELYLQSWMYSNQRFIDEVHELQNKVFSEEEIREYRNKNPIIPEYIGDIMEEEFRCIFGGEELSAEKKQQKEDYFNNPQLLSEEEAQAKMKKDNEDKISKIMEFFNLQHFKDTLRRPPCILQVRSDPIYFDISKNEKFFIRILKGNSGYKKPFMELSKGEEYDYVVSSDQIFIIRYKKYKPEILAYIPDKEYPEGMLRSAWIQQENDNQFTKEFIAQNKELYNKFKGKVDFDRLAMTLLEGIIQEYQDK